jgi:hypothetical protein
MHALLNIFGQTLRTLWAHKLRSFLTMFGIAWSVGSLLVLAGVGEGFATVTSVNLRPSARTLFSSTGTLEQEQAPSDSVPRYLFHPSLPLPMRLPSAKHKRTRT